MRRESNLKRIIPMALLIMLASQAKADEFENSFKLLLKCERMHIQSVLKDKNLYTSSIDGIWGPKTASAIKVHSMAKSLKETYDDLLFGSNCDLTKQENSVLTRMTEEGIKYIVDGQIVHTIFLDDEIYVNEGGNVYIEDATWKTTECPNKFAIKYKAAGLTVIQYRDVDIQNKKVRIYGIAMNGKAYDNVYDILD